MSRRSQLWAVFWFGLMGSMMLALLGLITSIWAEKFDHAAAVGNFVVAPLSLLSGTFYSVDALSPTFAAISHANPFFYVISGFRYGFLGVADSPILFGALLLLAINLALGLICYCAAQGGVEDQGLSVSGHSSRIAPDRGMTLLRLSLALAVAAGSGALAVQAQTPPAGPAAPSRVRFAAHPYTSALDALVNYQSCGVNARAAAYAGLDRAVRESEAAARAKGLGPLLDELRHDWQALLAVSTRVACGGGPVRALAGARAAVRAFQAWVAAQPSAP